MLLLESVMKHVTVIWAGITDSLELFLTENLPWYHFGQ